MKRLLLLLTLFAWSPTLKAHRDSAAIAAGGVVAGVAAVAAVSALSTVRVAWTPFMLGIVDCVQAPAANRVCGLRANLLIGGDTQEMYGIETAGLYNTDVKFYGLQVAGIYNYAALGGGLQVAPVNNVNKLAGWQIGAVNVGDHFKGSQMGVVNYITGGSALQIGVVNYIGFGHGIQIGLVNVIEDSSVPFMPIFNARF